MSRTSFSGPVRSGTVKDGTITETGFNLGTVVLQQSQSYTTSLASSTSATTNLCVLPAGSLILDIQGNVKTTAGVTICAVSFGAGANTDDLVAFTTLGSLGRNTFNTTAGVSIYDTICSVDTTISFTVTASNSVTAGSGLFTIIYAQQVSVDPSSN